MKTFTLATILGWKHPLLQVPAAIFGAGVTYLYGGWSTLLGFLLFFVVADYLTGVAAAGKRGELRSSVGFWGILLKILIFLIVAIGHKIDNILGVQMFMSAAIFFYMANELLSIFENVGVLGLKVPDFLAQAVDILKGKSEIKND
jgi:toxin secretion/phage lysis holin